MTSRVTYGSQSWKPGRYLVTGSSQRTLPSSTSMPIAAAVIALVVEPMANSVAVSTALGLSELADAVALREDDLAVLDDGDREADGAPVPEGLRGVGVELLASAASAGRCADVGVAKAGARSAAARPSGATHRSTRAEGKTATSVVSYR